MRADCAECAEGYAPGVGYSCHECLRAGRRWGVGLAVGVAVLVVVSLVVADLVRVVDYTAHEDKDTVEEEEDPNTLERASAFCVYFFRRTLPCQAIKIVIVVWQITEQVGWWGYAGGDVFYSYNGSTIVAVRVDTPPRRSKKLEKSRLFETEKTTLGLPRRPAANSGNPEQGTLYRLHGPDHSVTG